MRSPLLQKNKDGLGFRELKNTFKNQQPHNPHAHRSNPFFYWTEIARPGTAMHSALKTLNPFCNRLRTSPGDPKPYILNPKP